MFQQPPLAWIIDRLQLTRGHSAQPSGNFPRNSHKFRRTFQFLEFSLSKRPPAIDLDSRHGIHRNTKPRKLPVQAVAKAGIEPVTSGIETKRSTNYTRSAVNFRTAFGRWVLVRGLVRTVVTAVSASVVVVGRSTPTLQPKPETRTKSSCTFVYFY